MGYISGYGRRLTPSWSISRSKQDLQGRFEIVLMFSTSKRLSHTQNLITTRNSMSSLDVKRCFEVMAINAAAK